jgi:hypothetical protein
LGLSLDELDQSALIQLSDVRDYYSVAKQQALNGEYEESLITIGKALYIVFQENDALRDFQPGVARSEDAIKLAGFGVHGNDYLALQEFLPTIRQKMSKETFVHYWEQAKAPPFPEFFCAEYSFVPEVCFSTEPVGESLPIDNTMVMTIATIVANAPMKSH